MSCLLGIETSADLCAVAVARSGAVLAKRSLHMPYGQAGHLMGLIQEVLEVSHVNWKDLTGVAVNRGPGSFTGIRAGMATAQGIALAGDLPVLGLTGFEIQRSLADPHRDLLVLIDTRREDWFGCFFKSNSIEPEFSKVMSYEEVRLSSEAHNSLQIIQNSDSVPLVGGGAMHSLEADDLLRAVSFYQERQPDLFSADPYYLREPEIHGKPASV